MPFRLASLRQIRLSIGTWMALVAVLASLPALAAAAHFAWQLVHDRQADARSALARRAAVAADAVALDLLASLNSLRALAASDASLQGDTAALRTQALRLVAADSGIDSISLTNEQNQLIVSTRAPQGHPLARSQLVEFEAQVPDRDAAWGVSPIVHGATGGALVVGLGLRMQFGARPHLLRLAVRPTSIAAVLQSQRWPADWTGTVIDQHMNIITRTREPGRFAGEPVSDSLQAFIRADGGTVGVDQTQTRDGIAVITAVAPVPGTGWFVSVGQPAEGLRQQVVRTVQGVLAAAALAVLLGSWAAWKLARNLSRQVRNMATAAHSASQSAGPLSREGRDSSVQELQVISGALRAARRRADHSAKALHHARHDALTGLMGRALFTEGASAALASVGADTQVDAALLYCDLDGFKQVNDRQGHDAGDQVLREVGRVLAQSIRAQDLAGRLGGDEFALLIVATAGEAGLTAHGVAQRVLDAIPPLADGLGCSIGLAVAIQGETLPSLIARADMALLQAKREGKSRVVAAALRPQAGL